MTELPKLETTISYKVVDPVTSKFIEVTKDDIKTDSMKIYDSETNQYVTFTLQQACEIYNNMHRYIIEYNRRAKLP